MTIDLFHFSFPQQNGTVKKKEEEEEVEWRSLLL
jgi:hypothetical protein